ncbi:hypothetical protein, partial [Streptomyces otsuchiensis]|uniref:hypothetical protein n=1 Tax=Streptomyces otsuchiensis TaxID=2681388 RepID=UPI00130049D7
TPGSHRPPPETSEITLRLAPEDSLTLQQIRDALVPVETRQVSWWRRALSASRPWTTFIGLGLAVVPVPWTGYSAATTWASCVYYARETGGGAIGYGLAIGALAFSSILIARARTYPQILISRCALGCAVVGVWQVVHPWDFIQALTGVTL